MNERSSAFWEVFCRIFVENTEANNFPPHHFAHQSFEFFAGEFVEAKKSSGTVQTFFRLRGFSAPKTPRFAGQKHHRLRKKIPVRTRCTIVSYSPFFGGGFNRVGYIEMGSQKDPKRHHPSIHPAAGEKDWHVTASPSWNPVRSVDPLSTKNWCSPFWRLFFQREERQQQRKKEGKQKKTAWPRKSDVCFWFGSNFVL